MNFVARTLPLAAGVIVWALHFSALYGLTALACARGTPGLVPWIVAIPTALAVVPLGALIVHGRRQPAGFEPRLAVGIAAIALLAVAWEAAAVLFVRLPCA